MAKEKPKTENKIERRVIAVVDMEMRVERAEDDKPTKLVGYAAKFDSLSEDLGGWFERIRPGAFANALEVSDTRALVNHNPDNLLGRTKSGTLTLAEDDIGLRYTVQLPDTQLGRDIAESVTRGDISGNSFAFTVDTDEWHMEDEVGIREIVSVAELFDVGPVTYPAYPDTTVAARSHTEWRENKTKSSKVKAVYTDPKLIDATQELMAEQYEEQLEEQKDKQPEPISAERQRQIKRAYDKAGRIIDRNKKKDD